MTVCLRQNDKPNSRVLVGTVKIIDQLVIEQMGRAEDSVMDIISNQLIVINSETNLALILLMQQPLHYNQDLTSPILAQLKRNLTLKLPEQQSYMQVNYLLQQVLAISPQQAEHHQKSIEEENIKQYFDETRKDQRKHQRYQYAIQSRFFKSNPKKPVTPKQNEQQDEPIQIIKSFSHRQPLSHKQPIHSSRLADSVVSQHSFYSKPKSRYSSQVQSLLQRSLVLMKKKRNFKLVRETMIEQQKREEVEMKKEKRNILAVLQHRDYSELKQASLTDIPNQEKYALPFVDYMKQKTQRRLNRQFYEQKVRTPESKLQKFQQFVLSEGELKKQAKHKLSQFYIKIREEMRRREKHDQIDLSKYNQ